MAYSTEARTMTSPNSAARSAARAAAPTSRRAGNTALVQRQTLMDASSGQNKLRMLSGLQLKARPVVQRQLTVGAPALKEGDTAPTPYSWFKAYFDFVYPRFKTNPQFAANERHIVVLLKQFEKDQRNFASEEDLIETLLLETAIASLKDYGRDLDEEAFIKGLDGKPAKSTALKLLNDHGIDVARLFMDNYVHGANPSLPVTVLQQLKEAGALGLQADLYRESTGGNNGMVYYFAVGNQSVGEWHVHWESGNKAGTPGWKRGKNGDKTETQEGMRTLLGSLWGKVKNFGGGRYLPIPD